MDKQELVAYLEKVDAALEQPTMLYIYGSAVCILLDEPDRTSLDIDVAAPYSDADLGALKVAAAQAGIPVNPAEETSGNHIEWIQPLRLCLPAPSPENEMLLWQGRRLTIRSGSLSDLIASKLIRYDDIDQGDIQYLAKQSKVSFSDVEDSARRLPPPFNSDAVVLENLENLRGDLDMWRGCKE
jgi:hypothetical protein